jgi:hypothetical protein
VAERLPSFAFPKGGGKGHGHPWDEWLDTTIWRLRSGEDFQGSTSNFLSTAWKRASSRGLGLRSHRDPDGATVVIQAFERSTAEPPEPETTR